MSVRNRSTKLILSLVMGIQVSSGHAATGVVDGYVKAIWMNPNTGNIIFIPEIVTENACPNTGYSITVGKVTHTSTTDSATGVTTTVPGEVIGGVDPAWFERAYALLLLSKSTKTQIRISWDDSTCPNTRAAITTLYSF